MSDHNIILEKTFSREHTLFYFGVWHNNNLYRMERWVDFNAENVLLIRNKSGVVDVWYNPKEIEKFNSVVQQKIENKDDYFQSFKSSFQNRWKKLAPYMKDKDKIQSLNELEQFYEEWIEWWTLMVMSMNIPEIEDLPEKVKEEALQLRKETQEYADEGDRVFLRFFKEHFPEYTDISSVILPREVFALQDNELTDEKLEYIRKRNNGCAVINGEVFLDKDKLGERLESQGITLAKKEGEIPEQERVDALKGQIAYEGVVSENAKIVESVDHLDKIKEGDIIVSTMTTPDFVPAMKRATAFVTDEGGITSHAAITAREMEKPCIVGTEVATQVLEDGDTVEVNANEGVVRIINKVDE